MSALLPIGYEALESFVEQWAAADLVSRAAARDISTAEERRAFHEAASPLAAQALALLGPVPRAAMTEPQQRLLDLLLAYAHLIMAVEVQGPAEPRHAALRVHMRITPG